MPTAVTGDHPTPLATTGHSPTGHSPTGRPVALVTGATGGMGTAIVAELSSTHDVVALGRSSAALDALAATTGCRTQLLELTDFAAFASVADALPRVDVLVHAAAIAPRLAVAAASVDDWELVLRSNVIAPAELTRVLLPQLRAAEGTVVFIGSGAGTRAIPGSAVYTASKHALKAIADVLRIDEASTRLRVATVAPGQTDTPLLRSGNESAGEPYEPEKYIRPSSVADAVRFVVDAPADVHITDIAVRPRRELA
ncbi:MAG: SDR family oxidoreductase [Microterricola sp.]